MRQKTAFLILGFMAAVNIVRAGSVPEPLYVIDYPWKYSTETRKKIPTEIIYSSPNGVPVELGIHRIGAAKSEVNRDQFVGLVDRLVRTGAIHVATRNSGVSMYGRNITEDDQSIIVTDRGRMFTAADHPGIENVSAPVILVFSYTRSSKEITLTVRMEAFR